MAESSPLSHGDFIELYNKWHAGLGAAFIGCLKSSEYMHTRTALIISSKMVDYFPTKSTLGEKLLESLAPLQEDSNPMQDIKAMAQGYSSKIIIARDTGRWKEECSKITKAREEKERQIQIDRKENAKKQLEEMEKEMANSKPLVDSRHERRRDDRRDERRGGPDDRRGDRRGPEERRGPPRFTPAQKKPDEAASQPHGDRNGRAPDTRGQSDQNIRRNEPRGSERGGVLPERWERNGQDVARGSKRGRSPEGNRNAPDRNRQGDRDRRRGGDVTPPQRPRTRARR